MLNQLQPINWKDVELPPKRYDSKGHVLVYQPGHPKARNNYVPEHKLVISLRDGRWPTKDEVVTWKNGDRTDNRPENLVVTPRTRKPSRQTP